MLPIEGMTCASCVRRVERALTQGPRRRERQRQPRHRAGERVVRSRSGGPGSTAAGGREGRLRGSGRSPTAAPAATATASAAGEVDEREIARNHEIADLKRKSLVSLAIGLAMMAADVPAARRRAWRRSRRSC